MPEIKKEKIINNIKATMAVEGQYITAENVALISDFLDKKVSKKEAVRKIRERVLGTV